MKTKLNQIVLGMTLYYQLVLNSAWVDLDANPTWKYVGYLCYAVMIVMILKQAWRHEFTVTQLVSEAGMLGFMGLFLAVGNLSVAIVFLFGIFITFMKPDTVLDTYLGALITSWLTVFLASLLGILPLYDVERGFWLFGFKNPNMTGYYLAVIVVLLLVRTWGRVDWRVVFGFGLVSGIAIWYLEDWTALLTLFVALGLWVIDYCYPRVTYAKVPRALIISAPLLLSFLAYFIAWGWAHLHIIRELNKVFTARPDIWHYYSFYFKARLIGSNLPNPLVYANGAFDGGFVYYPFTNGLLVSVVLLIALVLALHYLVRQRQTRYIALILIFLVFAFSENPSFFAFQSPLLPLVLGLALPGFAHDASLSPLDTEIAQE